jgi:hypothetical protein
MKNCHRQLTEASDWTSFEPAVNSKVKYIPRYVDLVACFMTEAIKNIPFKSLPKKDEKCVPQYCLEIFEILVSIVFDNFNEEAAQVLLAKVGTFL